MIQAIIILLLSISDIAQAEDTAHLFSDSTLLAELPTKIIFRINQDILVNPDASVVYFSNPEIGYYNSHCTVGGCRMQSDFVRPQLCIYPKKPKAFDGCEIVLKSSSNEPGVIQKGTMLEVSEIESSNFFYDLGQYSSLTEVCYFPKDLPARDIFLVSLKVKNSEVAMIRCGSKSASRLTKGFLKLHIPAISLFAAPIRKIQ